MKPQNFFAVIALLGLSLPAVAQTGEKPNQQTEQQTEQNQKPNQQTEQKTDQDSDQKADRVKVPRKIIEGYKTHSETPVYPPAARVAGIEGDVLLRAIIGTDGKISQLRLIEGNPLLAQAAMDAVRKWRYRPYVLEGKPVTVDTMITVHFRLGNSAHRGKT